VRQPFGEFVERESPAAFKRYESVSGRRVVLIADLSPVRATLDAAPWTRT
jgi:hypothetical protein